MHIKFPDDVEQRLLDAEEFSRQVRKKLNANTPLEKRITPEELVDLNAQGKKQCLETQEIVKLESQVASAQEWLTKAVQSLGVEMPLKEQEKLMKAGRALPVRFGEPYDKVCDRYAKSIDLQKRIQATFKSKKTRGTAD